MVTIWGKILAILLMIEPLSANQQMFLHLVGGGRSCPQILKGVKAEPVGARQLVVVPFEVYVEHFPHISQVKEFFEINSSEQKIEFFKSSNMEAQSTILKTLTAHILGRSPHRSGQAFLLASRSSLVSSVRNHLDQMSSSGPRPILAISVDESIFSESDFNHSSDLILRLINSIQIADRQLHFYQAIFDEVMESWDFTQKKFRLKGLQLMFETLKRYSSFARRQKFRPTEQFWKARTIVFVNLQLDVETEPRIISLLKKIKNELEL